MKFGSGKPFKRFGGTLDAGPRNLLMISSPYWAWRVCTGHYAGLGTSRSGPCMGGAVGILTISANRLQLPALFDPANTLRNIEVQVHL